MSHDYIGAVMVPAKVFYVFIFLLWPSEAMMVVLMVVALSRPSCDLCRRTASLSSRSPKPVASLLLLQQASEQEEGNSAPLREVVARASKRVAAHASHAPDRPPHAPARALKRPRVRDRERVRAPTTRHPTQAWYCNLLYRSTWTWLQTHAYNLYIIYIGFQEN